MYQQSESSESKVKFRQASNRCKRVLEAAKLAYGNKTKGSITSQKLGSRDFWRIANKILSKGKSAILPLFNDREVLSFASDKAKSFAKNFSKNSNLDDSGISLPVFPSRTNLKLHNIYLTPKMVTSKKVIMNLDLSKTSGPDCIPVVVLRNCVSELSYIYLNSSICVGRSLVFQIVEMCHRWSLYLRMSVKGIQLKTTALLAFFLWLVKSLKNLYIIGLFTTQRNVTFF